MTQPQSSTTAGTEFFAEPFALARRGLPLPMPSHTPLRAPWLPASLRSRAQPLAVRVAKAQLALEPEIATDQDAEVQTASAPMPGQEDEPWWVEAAQWSAAPETETQQSVTPSALTTLTAPPVVPVEVEARVPAAEVGAASSFQVTDSVSSDADQNSNALEPRAEMPALRTSASTLLSLAPHAAVSPTPLLLSERPSLMGITPSPAPEPKEHQKEEHQAARAAPLSEPLAVEARAIGLITTQHLRAPEHTPPINLITPSTKEKNIQVATPLAPQIKVVTEREVTQRQTMGTPPLTAAMPTGPAALEIAQRREALAALSALNAAPQPLAVGVRIDEVTLSISVSAPPSPTPTPLGSSIPAPTVPSTSQSSQVAARPYRNAWSSYFARRD